MPARAAALCTRLLPTGKTCAQPALRGERLCRFHNSARARAIAEHDERIFALSDELDAMTIPQLLETVHDKLFEIRSTVRAFGEAKLAVIVAVQRLAELTAEGYAITRAPRRASVPAAPESPMPSQVKSMTPQQTAQNQRPPLSSNQLNDFASSLLKSMTSPHGAL
jgi:hypothetical protein